MEAELIVDCKNCLGEGVFHDEQSQCLWWVNIPMPSRLFRYDYATGQCQDWEFGEMISYAVPKASGGMLIASHGGLNSFDTTSGEFTRLKQLEEMLPFNRSNDACCDAQGRLWVGTMQNNNAPDTSPIEIIAASGSLYRVDADLSINQICAGIEIPNSLCFDPSGTKMYFADSPTKTIWVYDLDMESGIASNRQDFAHDERGAPDGATVDSEGGVWSARFGGSCVTRFLPDGSIDQVVELPCSQVTCCTFGGPELDTLYITTANIGLDQEQLAKEPHAGGLFAAKPGVRGVPDFRFAG